MGNAQSGMAYRKLAKELPPVKQMGHTENWDYQDLGMKVFQDTKDRDQFIQAVFTVATNNGLVTLEDHDFKVMYSRRESNEERMVCRIVAIKDGVIKAKIEPEADGADQREAFLALRRHVETALDRILQSIPDRGYAAAGAPQAGSSSDLPPAYTSGSHAGLVAEKTSN